MTESNEKNMTEEQVQEAPKKMTLAEAAKLKLAQKKQQQAEAGGKNYGNPGGTHTMKSQNTKKVNNQRKKMGV